LLLVFVIPDPQLFPSGGNLYNFHLIQALKERACDIQVADFKAFKTMPGSGSDTFYFFDTLYFNDLLAFEKPLNGCYLIVHHLGSLYSKEEEGDVFKLKEQRVLERFDGFLTTSNFTKNYLLGKGLTGKRYLTIPPALCFQPVPKKKVTDKIQALFVSNLIERKGILPFLKALQKTEIRKEHCQILIVGSSEIEPAYAQECIDLILKDDRLSMLVHYKGACNQKQIQNLYRQSNLFISTAFLETFGMALQEAVAHRLPVLAFDGGNVSYHLQEGKNGYLFASIEALVSKLEYLCQTKEKFEKLVESAWNFRSFENYEWSQAADQLLIGLKARSLQ